MRSVLAVLAVTAVALTAAVPIAGASGAPATAAKRGCGTMKAFSYRLYVRIRRGHIGCATTRKVMRRSMKHQQFRSAGHQWTCAFTHGPPLLVRGIYWSCATPGPRFSIIIELDLR